MTGSKAAGAKVDTKAEKKASHDRWNATFGFFCFVCLFDCGLWVRVCVEGWEGIVGAQSGGGGGAGVGFTPYAAAKRQAPTRALSALQLQSAAAVRRRRHARAINSQVKLRLRARAGRRAGE